MVGPSACPDEITMIRGGVSPIIEGAGQVFAPSHNSQAIATAMPAGQVVSLLGVLFINFPPTLPSCLSASWIPTTLTEYQQQLQKVSRHKLVLFKFILNQFIKDKSKNSPLYFTNILPAVCMVQFKV